MENNIDHFKVVTLGEFINKDLKVFSNLDNVRSIPSLIDGLKDSQRKALYGMIEHGNSEIRVSQLAGSASLKTHYNHGETSMASTIVGMAQRFPGANNINLLEPIGQFGSILDSSGAAVRYIYTKPSEHMKKIINKDDDLIIEYREEEGSKLEPVNYLPIIPLWLVNGSVGIGTGHSVKILPRDPKKVVNLISKIASGVNVQQKTIDNALTPSFTGWSGTINNCGDNTQWELVGNLEKVNTTTIRITELPVTYNINKYKSVLIKLMDNGKVKDFDNNSSEEGFDFTVSVPREIGKLSEDELLNLFKLKVRVGETVTLWDSQGSLKKYPSVYEALLEFIEFRLTKYSDRKIAMLESMDQEVTWMNSKMEFIEYWNTKMKNPHKKSKKELESELGWLPPEHIERLLAMSIRSLTMEQVDDLKNKIDKINTQISDLKVKSEQNLFVEDLNTI